MQTKKFLFWYWEVLSLFIYTQLSGFMWEKNRSCTQRINICKLETCKAHLQKVVQFTLAKRKHVKLQHTEILFSSCNTCYKQILTFSGGLCSKTTGIKYFACLTFLGETFVTCTLIMLSSKVICTSKCHE